MPANGRWDLIRRLKVNILPVRPWNYAKSQEAHRSGAYYRNITYISNMPRAGARAVDVRAADDHL